MNTKTLTRFAVIVALIFVAYTIDTLVSKFSPIRCAIATVIVIMTIIQLFDFKTAVFTTTMFGLISFAYSYLIPTKTAMYFNNPLVSVFPRIMIGIVSFYVYKAMNNTFKDSEKPFFKNYFTRAVAGGAGVLTNTVLVITMMQLKMEDGDVFGSLVQTMIGIFFIIEFFSGLVVVPVISKTVKERLMTNQG